jgi:hypothetical protein
VLDPVDHADDHRAFERPEPDLDHVGPRHAGRLDVAVPAPPQVAVVEPHPVLGPAQLPVGVARHHPPEGHEHRGDQQPAPEADHVVTRPLRDKYEEHRR